METTQKTSRKKDVTLADVARLAGTAKSTASLALNGKSWVSQETRQAVINAARELNFVPLGQDERSLPRDLNNDIALFTLQFDLGCSTQKIQGIQKQLLRKGYRVPIYGFGYVPAVGEMPIQAEQLQEVLKSRPRCLIYNSQQTHRDALDALQNYVAQGGILVTYDIPLDLDCDQVHFDRENSLYLAVKHLLELGHRRIGVYRTGQKHYSNKQYEILSRILKEYGLKPELSWIFPSLDPDESEADGAGLAAQFLQLPPGQRPTGLCVQADHSAISFLGELRSAGIYVPHDVSVVGQDNRPLGRYSTPPLTTVTQPVDEIVNHVVELVESRLNGYNGKARHIRIKGDLVLRQSTAAPPIGQQTPLN
jgi:DNA-binding LacI/PurR family transcriptional regulator